MDFAWMMAAVGSILVLLWIFLYVRYHNKFNEVIAAINKKEFMLPDIFFIGFGVIDLLKLNLQTPKSRMKIKKIAEVRGEKFAQFYHYVIVGGKFSYALTIAPLGFFIGALANSLFMGILGLVGAAALVAYLDVEVNNAVNKRREELLLDFPQTISKLALLVNAGLILREAWFKVAVTGDGELYKEMQLTSDEMRNGISDVDAISNFAHRCAIKEIRKFASVVIQNLQKGNSDLYESLKEMGNERWEEKKHNVKRKGELAGQKLLIPTIIMFVGILLVIMVPMFMNMF